MITALNLANNDLTKNLYRLQKVAYQIEADMLEFYEIPPLMESFEQFLKSNETFYAYLEGDDVVGAVSIAVDKELVEVTRMMVDPNHFRKGIAKALLHYVESKTKPSQLLKVATGAKNTPAICLYRSSGYQFVERKVVKGSVELVYFQKEQRTSEEKV
ncbi:GNAT family N-acetyltransferase [Alkalihalobacillus sp. LMS6]|uniref:GNAT family N-acetyltransferase n=1 Tax=Bacillaceae TaxID=186817 RepID=UPI000C08C6CF|nr:MULTISPECIES: GNAT family N-acetyltransferase [Bacillaceae]UTR07392.1 GNAT family N-acetyltransferase [Alkalihalobacillus sp. LMS6]